MRWNRLRLVSKNILILVLTCWSLSLTTAAELWVSTEGSDHNPGTQAQPFASIAAAQREAGNCGGWEKWSPTNRCALFSEAGFIH